MNNLKIVQTNVIENRLEYAQQLDRQAKQGLFHLVAALKRIDEECLYVELGYNSTKDYCQKSLNYSFQSAGRMLQITDKFGPFLDEGENRSHVSDTIMSLDQQKLYSLSRLPQDQISELIQKGEVRLNGSTLSMEVIKTTSREDLAKIISSAIYEGAPGVKKTTKEKSLKSLTERKVDVMNSIKKFATAVYATESETIIEEFFPLLNAINVVSKKHLEK